MADLASPWIVTAIGSVPIAIGVGLYVASERASRKAAESRAWPLARAEILASTVVQSRDFDGDPLFTAQIRYRYSVAGRAHESERVEWGDRTATNSRSRAESYVARFPAGARVLVAYDPGQPEQCVLDPDGDGARRVARIGAAMSVVVGLAFIAASLLLL